MMEFASVHHTNYICDPLVFAKSHNSFFKDHLMINFSTSQFPKLLYYTLSKSQLPTVIIFLVKHLFVFS